MSGETVIDRKPCAFRCSLLAFSLSTLIIALPVVSTAQDSCKDILVSGVHNTYQNITKSDAKRAYKDALCDEHSNLNQSGSSSGGGASYMGIGASGHHDTNNLSDMKSKYCHNSSSDMADDDFNSLVQVTIDPNIVENWKECMASHGSGLLANVDVNGADVMFTVEWKGFAGVAQTNVVSPPQVTGAVCPSTTIRSGLILKSEVSVTDLCHRLGKTAVSYVLNTGAGSKVLKLEEIPDTSQVIAPVRYRPAPEPNTWSSAMQTVVNRIDRGPNNHFSVEFVVPNPPNIPGPPMNYPFNLITVYGFQISGSMRNDLPLNTVPSRMGTWKPGDKITLEFDLPKQFADPTLGWDLRFCAGSKAGCLPSPNLLQGYPL